MNVLDTQLLIVKSSLEELVFSVLQGLGVRGSYVNLCIVDEEGYYKHKPPIWQGLMPSI